MVLSFLVQELAVFFFSSVIGLIVIWYLCHFSNYIWFCHRKVAGPLSNSLFGKSDMNARAGQMANDVPHPSSMNDEIASSVSDGEDASMWRIFFFCFWWNLMDLFHFRSPWHWGFPDYRWCYSWRKTPWMWIPCPWDFSLHVSGDVLKFSIQELPSIKTFRIQQMLFYPHTNGLFFCLIVGSSSWGWH